MNIDERKERTVFKPTKKKKKNYGIRQCPRVILNIDSLIFQLEDTD